MLSSRCSFVIFSLSLVVVAGSILAKTKSPEEKGITALGWLAGKWVLESRGSRQEEVWTAPAGGSMIGMMRVTREGKTAQREFNLIEEGPSGVALTLGHVGQDMKFLEGWPVTLKMVKCTDSEALFEAGKGSRLKSIFYRKTGENEILAGVEIDRNGTVRKIEFPMKREKL